MRDLHRLYVTVSENFADNSKFRFLAPVRYLSSLIRIRVPKPDPDPGANWMRIPADPEH